MIETLELELSLEHINNALIDVPCTVEIEYYKGSNETDDPSEINVLSIFCAEAINHFESGKWIMHNGEEIKLDDNLEKQIIKKYEQYI